MIRQNSRQNSRQNQRSSTTPPSQSCGGSILSMFLSMLSFSLLAFYPVALSAMRWALNAMRCAWSWVTTWLSHTRRHCFEDTATALLESEILPENSSAPERYSSMLSPDSEFMRFARENAFTVRHELGRSKLRPIATALEIATQTGRWNISMTRDLRRRISQS